jgi:hypothetical protein
MTTVGFMSAKMPATFMVDDDVAVSLVTKASDASKSGETASKYVNRLLKWALENYEVRNNVAEQVPNN